MTDGLSFSQRMGLEPVKNIIQVDSMDSDLRNGLWNCLYQAYFSQVSGGRKLPPQSLVALVKSIWNSYYKKRIDDISPVWKNNYSKIRVEYFSSSWNEVYDFIEFVAKNYQPDGTNEYFTNLCNTVMIKELSGFRFIDRTIVPLTSEVEIAEIEEALRNTNLIKPVHLHLQYALDKFANRESPDYRDSIKESISSVEALCRIIAKKEKATLGKALDKIDINIHTSLKTAFKKMYGWTSDAEGIRHALMEVPTVDSADAKFMLVSCSAFVNYLIVKANSAGISLT